MSITGLVLPKAGQKSNLEVILGFKKVAGCLYESTRNTHDLIKISDNSGVRRITLSDTKTRNSLSMAMVDSLLTAVNEKKDDISLRCIVFDAEGKVFSAGHNLKELISVEGKEVFKKCSELMLSLVNSPVPVIAAVDGLAAAAGCQLVAQCDIIICTKQSAFSTPGASFGVFCSTPGVAVARAVPKTTAAHMLFTGLPLSAEQALKSGLVFSISENKSSLEKELKIIIDAIVSKSRPIVEMGKRTFYRQIQMDLPRAYDVATTAMLNNLELPDGKEGLQSFAEKRKPVWKNEKK